jgi:hypothetical protein
VEAQQVTLPLTPQMLAAAYEYLRATPPFRRWKLPAAEQVKFCVIRARDRYGDHRHYRESDEHEIRLSLARIGHTQSLIETMAHEMVHAYEHHKNPKRPHGEHSNEWRRLAALVCKYHGFDPKSF